MSVRNEIGRRCWLALRSPLLPFEVRAKLLWWADMRFRRPITYNELIRQRKAMDRRPLLTTFADKVAVRDYVARAVGADVLPECYAVVDDPALIDRSALPREFVVKASHGSGGVWLVTEQAPLDGPQPQPGTGWTHHVTHPDVLDWELLVIMCRQWLAQNFGQSAMEWAYLNVPPRIIVEEFLGPAIPNDYKFQVFHGVPRLVGVDTGRYGEHRRTYFTPTWEPLDLEIECPRSELEIPRPSSLDRMLEIASRLGEEVDFVRVDLYDVDGRVVFGELTNYPGSGVTKLTPHTYDLELGRWWMAKR